jgi:hypothetical protein
MITGGQNKGSRNSPAREGGQHYAYCGNGFMRVTSFNFHQRPKLAFEKK